jgi:hypothetical protein
VTSARFEKRSGPRREGTGTTSSPCSEANRALVTARLCWSKVIALRFSPQNVASKSRCWLKAVGFGLHSIATMRFAFSIIVVLGLVGCSTEQRGDIIDVREFPSPDSRYVCTVFGEIFYNTTGYPRHIAIRHAGEKRGHPGNVYVVPVGGDVSVSWTSPTNLSVRLKFETPRALPASTNVAGVAVTFSDMPK